MRDGVCRWVFVGAAALCCCRATAGDWTLWLLNGAPGNTVADAGTAGMDLELRDPAWADAGPFPDRAALAVDGDSGRFATFAGPVSGEQGTVEMWIRPQRLQGSQALFSTKFGSTSRLMLALQDGDLLASDYWWNDSRSVRASAAFTAADTGRWTHVALVWDQAGYRLYKNGTLAGKAPGTPFPTRSVEGALGVNSWDMKSMGFAGDMAQVRVSAVALPPGQGTGRDELAYAVDLHAARLLRPVLKWLPGPNPSNLFVRAEAPALTLQIRNPFAEALAPLEVSVTLTDLFRGTDLPVLAFDLDQDLASGAARELVVAPQLERAGVYRVTARGLSAAQAVTRLAWVKGPAPEDDTGPVPFFGNSSHDEITPWAYAARREFGSRFERSLVYWHWVQNDAGEFTWCDIAADPLVTVVQAQGGAAYGFSGYTPAFASSAGTEAKPGLHDMPRLVPYIEWLTAAARHYAGVIRYWEIWNEPNGTGTFLRGSAEQVADLHKAAALALRQVDPNLRTIGASTVSVDPEYLDRLDDAGAVDYMGVIAFHNYVWNYPPEPVIRRNLERICAWRDKTAPGRPLWDDEWGYDATAHALDRHAVMTGAQLIMTRAAGIQHTAVYTWSWADHHLFDGYVPEPAAVAYRTVAQQLTNARPTAAICEGDNGRYAYLFERRGEYLLAAWTSRQTTAVLAGIPMAAETAVYTDLMGNRVPVAVADGLCTLELERAPRFLTGVDAAAWAGRGRTLAASPEGKPPVRHPAAWLSFRYPSGSEVVGLSRGRRRALTVRVFNQGSEPVSCRLTAVARDRALQFESPVATVQVQPMACSTAAFEVTAAPAAADGLHIVEVTGLADDVSCGRIRVRCYVADGEVVLFHMATWEMQQHTVAAEHFGQGIHIRWFEPGGFITFRFDLTAVKSARLWGEMGSVSPAENDGGTFRVSARTDTNDDWKVLLEGTGQRAWRGVDLAECVGGPVFVRFDHPAGAAAKGYARCRQWRLETFPPRPDRGQVPAGPEFGPMRAP